MTNDIGFEPYQDYSKITNEMVQDLHVAAVEMRAAHQQMIDQPTRDSVERLMKAHDVMNDTHSAIYGSLWTVPSMVHIAGEPQEETMDPDDPTSTEVVAQRCTRCKSVLMGWQPGMGIMDEGEVREVQPDDMAWHKVGSLVAKINQNHMTTVYLIEDRELEPHERECVGFEL